MAEYTITIPNWHPAALNTFIGSRYKAMKVKAADLKMIWAYTRATKIPYQPIKRRVHLTITLEPKQRSCDPDAYWKSLCDALVKSYALWNDSAKWCEIMPVEFVRADKKSTIIRLTDMEAA